MSSFLFQNIIIPIRLTLLSCMHIIINAHMQYHRFSKAIVPIAVKVLGMLHNTLNTVWNGVWTPPVPHFFLLKHSFHLWYTDRIGIFWIDADYCLIGSES